MNLEGLGILNLKNLKSLALSGSRLGLEGGILCLHLFLDMHLIFCLLVNTGVGGLGKSGISFKSFHIRFHFLLRICFTGGWHSVNFMHRGLDLSTKGFHFFCASMVVLWVCFSCHTCFNMHLLYPLRLKLFMSPFLYFSHRVCDVVLSMILVVSSMAIPFWMCDSMQLIIRGNAKVLVGL